MHSVEPTSKVIYPSSPGVHVVAPAPEYVFIGQDNGYGNSSPV